MTTGRARGRTSARLVVAALLTVLLAPRSGGADVLPPPAVGGPTTVTVDAGAPVAELNRRLVGFGWHDGAVPLASIAPLHPDLVRIDANLETISTGPGAPLRLDDLLARVAEVRGAGGEPLVILSYLPAWMATPNTGPRDPTRVRPADLAAWERLVHDVVLALATAPSPALRFEAWNEPDVPLFWQDSPLAWVDLAEASGRAIATVEQETGLDLAFGGPAMAVPDPAYLVPFLERFRDATLPLDFVSWHYYGNYPFFGPDGAEFPLTAPIQPIVGRPNPIASPSAYPPQVDFVRSLTELTLAGSGRPMPELVIDEWNLSAAGFDRRHDTAAGAAFAAGVLSELQRAGLDAAAFFRATDTSGVPGEHGAVRVDGTPKPVWWVFDLWRRLADTVVTSRVDGPSADLFVVATAAPDRVVVLLSSFSGDPSRTDLQQVTLDLTGLRSEPVAATVRRIDDRHPAAAGSEPAVLDGWRVALEVPLPGVALVEIRLAA
ncbi:MAG: GH39 family glycosyl hydrolase [Acidimicrobiales bacterium]